jgi:hypothetical protein
MGFGWMAPERRKLARLPTRAGCWRFSLVLVSPVSADIFNGSKVPSILEQFVAPRNRQLRVWPLGPVDEHESVPLPMQTRHSRGFLLVGDFTSIRHALKRVLERLAIEANKA